MIDLKLIAKLMLLADSIKVKSTNIERRGNKIVAEVEFESEDQASIVFNIVKDHIKG
jgi:ribosome-associated protein YbcJ (S4-like RNA binding protein)